MYREVYEIVKKAKTYFLATADEQNIPHLRPLGTFYINDAEDKLYFITGRTKEMVKQMNLNPNIEIGALVDRGWIRIQAKAFLNEDAIEQTALLNKYPNIQKMGYTPGGGDYYCMYELRDVHAQTYSSGSSPSTSIL